MQLIPTYIPEEQQDIDKYISDQLHRMLPTLCKLNHEFVDAYLEKNKGSIDLTKPATYHNYLHEVIVAIYADAYNGSFSAIPSDQFLSDEVNMLFISALMHDDQHSQGLLVEDWQNVEVAIGSTFNLLTKIGYDKRYNMNAIAAIMRETAYPHKPADLDEKLRYTANCLVDADMSTVMIVNSFDQAYLFVGLYNEMTKYNRFTGTIDEFLVANTEFINTKIVPRTSMFNSAYNGGVWKKCHEELRGNIAKHFGV